MPLEMTSHTLVHHLYSELEPRVSALRATGRQPHLAVVLVGHDPKSELYVSSIKQKRAQDIGIEFTVHRLSAEASQSAVIETIKGLNAQPAVTGIIVQLPLPDHLAVEEIINSVAEEKDVDGLRPDSRFMAPTVVAILHLLEAYDIQLTDRRIAVVGKGRLVGSPLLAELRKLRLDVTACDESTNDLEACTVSADILISATGQPHLIQPAMVKEQAVVIDVDTDVDYSAVAGKVAYITPQTGGVGPLTVAYLLSNVVEAAERLPEASVLEDEPHDQPTE